MQLFVGLGNPGAKYARNRHNIGFMAVDRIAADHGFGPWKAKFQGLLAEGRLGGDKVLLLKPQTYMNLSGQSVGEAMRFYKLGPDDITVLHDELDLPPGKLRIKRGGGHAGHNGLRSIHAHAGADFRRVRLGIGHPGHKDLVSHYVLQDVSRADSDQIAALLDALSGAAPDLAQGRDDRVMNAVARTTAAHRDRDAPPRGGPAAPAGAADPPPKPADAQPPKPRQDTRSPLQKLVDRFR